MDSVQTLRPAVFNSDGGIPLFWSERKPVVLWRKILEDMSARCIVDLTPGAGLCARAAIELGIPYLGITRTPAHCDFLGKVCDRSAVLAAVTTGSALHTSDLQGTIEEHFGDIVGHLRDTDAMDDPDYDGDDVQE